MNNSDEVREYFERISTEHRLIKQFYFGDYDEILGAERSSIEYPCLWYESPEIGFSGGDNDNIKESLSGSFVVLINSKKDDKERVRYNKAKTELIAKQIVRRMICDQTKEEYSFNIQRVNMYPIDNANNDNDQGWRVEFSISPDVDDFNFDEAFETIFPSNSLIKFEWANSKVENENIVQVTNRVTPDLFDFDSFEWTFCDGTNETKEVDDENPEFKTISNSFYIGLKVKIGEHVKHASTHCLDISTEKSGVSFLIDYNPFL